MKKLLFLSAACWLSALTASAIDWNVATNIAKGCATKASSARADMPSSNATDGIIGGAGWQAVIVGDEGTPASRSNDWLLIDLGESKDIADIEVVQQVARATQYDLYITTEEPTIVDGDFDGELKIDANWLAGNTPVYSHNESNEPESVIEKDGTYYDLHHLATPTSGRYLLMYTREYDAQWASKYGTRVYEILVGEYTADYNKVKSIAIDNLILPNGETVTYTVTPYTGGGNASASFEGVENLTLTVSDPDAVTIEGGENGVYTITGKKMGLYTLTAQATIDGQIVTATASLDVQFSWAMAQNVALNKTAYASHNAGEANLSVDGNLGTRWQVGADIRENTWYYVDLGGSYTISAIAPTWEAAYASHYKYYTATELDGNDEPAWVELAEVQKTIENANQYTDTYVLTEPKEARYVKLECIKSEVWGMSFYELQVAGKTTTELVATEISLKAAASVLMNGQSTEITAIVKDNYANHMDVTPTLSIAGGEGELQGNVFTATQKGRVTIEAAYEGLKASIEINVAANADEKIGMGGATATADEQTTAERPASNAIDGDGNSLWETAQGEGAVEAEHWIQVDLDYAYDLGMITLSWEGASPADYKVYAGTDAENLTEVFTCEGQEGMKNYTDVIGADVKGVKTIKVVTTKNATGYGIKLFELEAYGTLSAGQGYSRETEPDSYGTLCLPFDATLQGADAYAVEGILGGNSIVLSPVDLLQAGRPYVFLATAGELEAAYAEGSIGVWTGLEANGLCGSLEGINTDKDEADAQLTGKYILVDGTWKLCGTGCSLAPNRAYINLEGVPVLTEASPNSLLMPFDNGTQTGIRSVAAPGNSPVEDIYTVGGVRVRRGVEAGQPVQGLPKGLYIRGGKKFIVR